MKKDIQVPRYSKAGASPHDGILLGMSLLSASASLASNVAHVWMFPTNISTEECAKLLELLSADERARADRFVFESDRIRYIASHGVLRMRLGDCCGKPPASLVFSVGSHGKPALSEPSAPLQFNLSHSGSLAALVVTPNIRCGIDIEKERSEISDQDIAERFFCARENAWLQSLPPDQKARGFFRLWSVKEAILKADGKGLSIPLNDVDATSVVDGTSSYVSLPSDDGNVLSLWVGELRAAHGYTSALAVEGTEPIVRIIQER
jgi:4'-phosphopantetheinyl transferase